MAEEKPDIFYVNVEYPTEIQRSVLECTKEVLGDLKRYEAFRQIRIRKIEYIAEFNNIMAEIKLLNNRLRRVLPKTGLRAITEKEEVVRIEKTTEKPKKMKKKAAKTKKPEPAPVVNRPRSNLDRLESELDEIEKRLKSLEH